MLGDGVLVGILNVTADSFSDGGEHFGADRAVSQGLGMISDGAGIVDVGGESTRPGADAVETAEELRRVVPVIEELADAGVTLSIDTSKAEVASRALQSGAAIVNDVTGFTDRRMVDVVAGADCGVVVMHGRQWPLNRMPPEVDPVEEVRSSLGSAVDAMVDAGVARERIAVDPGIGFAKRTEQSLALLAHLDRLVSLGCPVMVGTSRKGFLGEVVGGRGWESRDNATAATTALGFERGARLFRVHDVARSRDALEIAAAIVAPH
ncbi:MAG: dihydropteroate synthase [Acidimicrobiia bacterium]